MRHKIPPDEASEGHEREREPSWEGKVEGRIEGVVVRGAEEATRWTAPAEVNGRTVKDNIYPARVSKEGVKEGQRVEMSPRSSRERKGRLEKGNPFPRGEASQVEKHKKGGEQISTT